MAFLLSSNWEEEWKQILLKIYSSDDDAAKSLQSWMILCDPTDGRLPCSWDSPGKNTGVGCHFLLQCMKVKVKSLSRVRLLATPWTTAHQAPPSVGFSRQECHCLLPQACLITNLHSGSLLTCSYRSRHSILSLFPFYSLSREPWDRLQYFSCKCHLYPFTSRGRKSPDAYLLKEDGH